MSVELIIPKRRVSKRSDYERWFPPEDVLKKQTHEDQLRTLQQGLEWFAIEAVTTIDEHNKGVRLPLPIYGHMAYLRIAIQMLLRLQNLYWLKSRKVSATWMLLIYAFWKVHLYRDQLAGWVTQKEDDGKRLMRRYVTGALLGSLPDWMHAMHRYADYKDLFLIEKCQGQPWGSTLLPYPEGADQLRQFGHSLVIVDEAHLLTDLADLLQGISPGLKAAEGKPGGQLVLCGVGRRGSHFGRLLGAQRDEARKLAMQRLTRPPDAPPTWVSAA